MEKQKFLCSRCGELLSKLDIPPEHELSCLMEQMRSIPGYRDSIIRKILKKYLDEVIDLIEKDYADTVEVQTTFKYAKSSTHVKTPRKK